MDCIAPKALITGITGQDGSYMAEFLLAKGYEVHGIVRRTSTFNRTRIDHIRPDTSNYEGKLFLHYGELSDSEQISNIVYNLKPDEIYHLGAQSHVRISFDIPEYTGNVTGIGTARILEAVRRCGREVKFYQASSSEMFGCSPPPQNESTPFQPRSPYACAKIYAYYMTKNYREAYNIFACNGILFNHESSRRGENFVTKKITRGVSSIISGKQKYLYLGNLDARRDWGYTPEYVEFMWSILQNSIPDDFVIGTGESHSVMDFMEKAFSYAGMDYQDHVRIDPKYFRPTEVVDLIADSSKARKTLGWNPKIAFNDLVKIMIDADMRSQGLEPIGDGDRIIKARFPNRWWTVD